MGTALAGDTDRDSLKVSVVGRDSFKCRSNPLDIELHVPELSIFKTCRLEGSIGKSNRPSSTRAKMLA